MAALATLADDATRRADNITVIDLAERLIEADPYDTDGHRRLIEALDKTGRHGAAKRARDRYSHQMRELGIEP